MQHGQLWHIVNDPTGDPVVVQFGEWNCNVLMERYASGGLSLRLVDVDDKSSICRATNNLADVPNKRGEILIKNYAEIDGVLDALIETGLFADTHRQIDTGHGQLNILQLSDDVQEQWDKFQDQLPDLDAATQRTR